jgi:hypothetical protein
VQPAAGERELEQRADAGQEPPRPACVLAVERARLLDDPLALAVLELVGEGPELRERGGILVSEPLRIGQRFPCPRVAGQQLDS